MNKEFKGTNGSMVLTDTCVLLKKGGIKGFVFSGGAIRGDKTVPYSSIAAVQFKKAQITAGYIQLTLIGGTDATSGLMQAIKDENTISFNTWGANKRFAEAKEIIDEKIKQFQRNGQGISQAGELEKYAELRDKGVLSEEEFQEKKKQLLNL